MNQYSKRREDLLNSMKANCAFMLFSGKAIAKSADESYPFSVDRNFYYLTGLDAQEMVLLMYKIDGVAHEAIYILPYDEELAKWVGGRMLADEVTQISEIAEVNDLSQLDEDVSRLLNITRRDPEFKFLFDMWHYSLDQTTSLAIDYANKLKSKYPYLVIEDFFAKIAHARLVKDEYEIACMRKAIHITNLGIQQMMKTCKPGVNEATMEGVFDFVLKQVLCKEKSFETIAASGKNATILHYSNNDQVMNDGDLFLCDLGARDRHYCADISRTFPVNGTFSERQKEIYEIVLGAQKIVEENAKVGVKLKELNKMVIDYYAEELPKHGLNKDVREYYYHSCSHHIGLDCHDINDGVCDTLEVGNVISNEPGLYIEDENIGIRIEDDLLITENGAINLSQEIIKSVEDIENLMKGHK